MMKDLVQKNRSYRRFYQEKKITEEQVRELLDIARLTPSGANKQPIRYMYTCTEEENNKVFPDLRWARGRRKTYCLHYPIKSGWCECTSG